MSLNLFATRRGRVLAGGTALALWIPAWGPAGSPPDHQPAERPTHANIGGNEVVDYSPHHNPFA